MFEIHFIVVVKVVSGNVVHREGLDQLELDNECDTGRNFHNPFLIKLQSLTRTYLLLLNCRMQSNFLTL